MAGEWYDEAVAGASLAQGDFILDCPLLDWDTRAVTTASNGEELTAWQRTIAADVIVMSQACDLEHNKIENVVVCPHLILNEYRKAWEQAMRAKSQNPTSRAWQGHCDDIAEGLVWNLTMLNEGGVDSLKTGHRIVDFHRVFTIPREFLESLLRERGQPRLRLLPPYREHLSQAFARFFMRVGLPTDVTKSW